MEGCSVLVPCFTYCIHSSGSWFLAYVCGLLGMIGSVISLGLIVYLVILFVQYGTLLLSINFEGYSLLFLVMASVLIKDL
jgi:hypothetical protein